MKTVEVINLPPASPGTTRKLRVIRYGTGGTAGKVYIQAGLHADEAPGYVVLKNLIKLLDKAENENRISGEIIVVPAANPIGLAQWRDDVLSGRFNFCNSVNFNRQHQDLTEKIADRIGSELGDDARHNVDLIRQTMGAILEDVQPEDEAGFLKLQLMKMSHDADIVLDLHCDIDATVHVYMGTPLWPDGADLSAWVGAEATLLALDSGGTPFDEANSKVWWELAEKFPGKPIPSACLSATVELRGIADTDKETAVKDAENLFAFLQGRGIIRGEAVTPPPLVTDATPLTGVDYIKAEIPGIITYFLKPGARVKKGDLIAEIFNPLAEDSACEISLVKTRTDGILFSRNIDRFTRPGRIVAKVAGEEPLREARGNLLTL